MRAEKWQVCNEGGAAGCVAEEPGVLSHAPPPP